MTNYLYVRDYIQQIYDRVNVLSIIIGKIIIHVILFVYICCVHAIQFTQRGGSNWYIFNIT